MAKSKQIIDLQAFYDGVPEEQAQMLKQAAANTAGVPAEDLTVAQAVKILGGDNIIPEISAAAGKIARDVIANISDEQLEQLAKRGQAAAEAGTLQQEAVSIMVNVMKAIQDAHDVQGVKARTLGEAINAITKSIANSETLKEISQTARAAMNGITAFINSDEYKAIKENTEAVSAFIRDNQAHISAFMNLGEDAKNLAPFIRLALMDEKSNQDYTGYSIIDILQQGIDENGNVIESKFEQIIERAKQLRAEYDTMRETVVNMEEAAEELPKQYLIPLYHIMPNNALMNDLAGIENKQPINAGAYDLPVIPETKRQKEITIYVMAEYEPEKGFTSNLTEYERNVSDAIMSICVQAEQENKRPYFSIDSLYRAMPGRGERASKQQKEALTKAIEKFTSLRLEIDATDELIKRRLIAPGDTYHYKDYYLPAREHIYKAKGGQPVTVWEVTSTPINLDYAKRTGQILTVPAKYLEITKVKNGKISKEPLTMNADRQAMTSYMLRRIAVMQYDYKRAKEALRSYNRRRSKDKTLETKPLKAFRDKSDTILFDTLFKIAGTESTNREVTRRNRDFCFDVLDFWKASGLIYDYEQQTKGRSITGVKIKHNELNEQEV